MRATFQQQERQTDNISTFWFKPESPMQFTAGQFTELTLKHHKPDSRGDRRWFTISSAPSSELIGITTRFAGDDTSSSFKKALFSLEPNAIVQLDEPMGDFVLPKLLQTPIVFVAGGIGITPFHSIFEWLLDTDEDRNIHLFYAVQSEDDIIFQDTIGRSKVHTTLIVNEPSPAWGGEQGSVTSQMILGIDKPSDETLFYLSGPEPMLEALKKELLSSGVTQHQIVTDFFPGYSQI